MKPRLTKATPPNIIQVMNDPALLKDWFRGPSWDSWKVFLKSIFCIPMSDSEFELFKEMTARETVPSKPCTYVTIICGRRGGKTRILALVAIYLACFFRWHKFLAPGELGTIAVIAADTKQAKVLLRYVRGMLEGASMLKRLVVRNVANEIELETRACIEVMAGDYRLVRGRTILCGIVDEASFLQTSSDSANPDVEIINALKPGLASVPDSRMIVSSSAYTRRGQLYQDFRRLYSQEVADELCWKATTRQMNPLISQAFVDRELEKDYAAASSEYLSNFRDDLEAYIDRAAVEACVNVGVRELAPVSRRNFVFGLDPAGGSGQDSMTLCGAFLDGDVATLAVIREWRPRFNVEEAAAEAAAVIRSYGATSCHADKFGGDWPASAMRSGGVEVKFNEKSASEMFIEWLPMLNSKKVSILDHPRLITQICNLERRNTRSLAKPLVGHPIGQHDDLACCAATACVTLKAHPVLKISAETAERFIRHAVTMGAKRTGRSNSVIHIGGQTFRN